MNKEDYRLARAHSLACYDAGFIYATKQLPEDPTITFEFPNMNNNNKEEV